MHNLNTKATSKPVCCHGDSKFPRLITDAARSEHSIQERFDKKYCSYRELFSLWILIFKNPNRKQGVK